MKEEKLLTIRDVSQMLGITEKEVIDLAEKQVIPAYRLAGVYLRFKRQQIEEYRKNNKPSGHKEVTLSDASFNEKVSDFFYFNDFYIISCLIIIVILFFLFTT